VSSGAPTEFEIALLSQIRLGDVLSAAAPDLLSDLHRHEVTDALDQLDRLTTEAHDRPRFLFVHVSSPHAPWVFGPNGEPRTDSIRAFFSDPSGPREIDRTEALHRVYDQATYISRKAAEALAPIVNQSNPPVVVVFSDHGPGTGLNFTDPGHSDLAERSSNFLATFTPGKPDLFGSFTTPVNLFPKVLNGYLGANIPLAPDTLFTWSGSLLDIHPVPVPSAPSR
jgi:hypothetical protein